MSQPPAAGVSPSDNWRSQKAAGSARAPASTTFPPLPKGGRCGGVPLAAPVQLPFPHRRKAGDGPDLRLQLLQSPLGVLPLGQIPDEPDEEASGFGAHLAHGKLHREGRTVLALADHNTANPDDPAL